MPITGKKLLRFLPPALALAGLCAACAYGGRQIESRMQGYGDRRVVINEICAHNLSGLQDGNGAYGDWIELYNPGTEPVDLSGWTLSDDKDDPGRWTFPEGTVLEDYLIVFADRANATDPAGYCHTSFALRTDGETLYLYDAEGEQVDKLKYPEQDFDITYGRAFGSGEDVGTFATATPGAANPVDFLAEEREAPLGTAEFSLPAGFYEEPVEVALRAEDPEALIFYTTDGSDPRENGKLYTGPIGIESRAGEPNEYVSMANTVSGEFKLLKTYAYEYAPDPVDKATTVTACIYKDGSWSEEVTASTYWVGVEPHTLPVVSVTTDAQALFGSEGIYAPGYAYYTLIRTGHIGDHVNFMNGEETYANMQVVDGTGNASMPIHLSVSGESSRLFYQMKNLSVRLQSEMTTDLLREGKNSEEVSGISLKAHGNGKWREFYIDGFWNDYLYDCGLGTQYSKPVVLYLEDEYWGIYCARERKDEAFIARHFGVDKNSVVLCRYYADEIQTLHDELLTLKSETEIWDWATKNFDIGQFTDYLIASIYADDWDGFRTLANTIIWKATEGKSEQYTDGRWRFILNDLDMTAAYGAEHDPLKDIIGCDPAEGNLVQVMLQKLWTVTSFRQMLKERLYTAVKTIYSPQNILPAFDDWCNRLEPEMERNLTRQKIRVTWMAPLADWLTHTETDEYNKTMEMWYAERENLRKFFLHRAEYLLQYVEQYLLEIKPK